jgi:RimJ/RimL family protein N-acetyltransferase
VTRADEVDLVSTSGGAAPILSETDSITARRLDLTPLTPDDAAEMVDVLAGEGLYTFIGGSPPTLEELTARYARQVVGHSADGLETWHNWIIRTRPAGRGVGYVQATLTDEGRRAEIAWLVGLSWQRHGYAVEAATALVEWLEDAGVETVMANIHPDHIASASVARRIGMRPTMRLVEGERTWLLERDLESD